MKNQIFLQNFLNPMEKPINALMELNLKTLRNFSYFTPVELLSVKKPEEVLQKGMNAFIKNTQTSFDFFQNMFNVMESQLFHLNDDLEHRPQIINRPVVVTRARPKTTARRTAAKRVVASAVNTLATKPTAKKTVAKKAAPRSVAKKVVGTKSVAKKAIGTKSVARKASPSRSVAKKVIGAKSIARKASPSRSVAKKVIGTKSVARKAVASRSVAKKVLGAKQVSRKVVSTKPVAKKTVAKKVMAKKTAIAKKATPALRNNAVKSKSVAAKNTKPNVSMKQDNRTSFTSPSSTMNKDPIKSNSFGYNPLSKGFDDKKAPVKGMNPSQDRGFNADRKPLINQEISKMNPISNNKPYK